MKQKQFDYKQDFKRASKNHKVYVYPLKSDGTKDYDKGRYVAKPEDFKFALPYRKRAKRFEGNRARCTFDPNTGEARSYGHWRFVWKVKNTYIFNTYSYSNTTSGHQSKVSCLLRELGIKNVLRVNLGSSGTIDAVYSRLFQYEIEQKRKGAKSRKGMINAEKRTLAKLRALGFKPRGSIKELKAGLIGTENARIKRMQDAATERKRLRDKIKLIAKTDPKDLDPKDMIKETNVEVRKILFNKIGGERVLRELNAKVLDKKDNYELVDLDLGAEETRWGTPRNVSRPFLKMLNPSTGEVLWIQVT
jgi:hypothetical protein